MYRKWNTALTGRLDLACKELVLFTFPNVHVEPVVKIVMNDHRRSTVSDIIEGEYLLGLDVTLAVKQYKYHQLSDY